MIGLLDSKAVGLRQKVGNRKRIRELAETAKPREKPVRNSYSNGVTAWDLITVNYVHRARGMILAKGKLQMEESRKLGWICPDTGPCLFV